jgi:hypothetical protein
MAQKKARQTFEKLKREQAVRERRLRKQERRAAARLAKLDGTASPVSGDADGEPGTGDRGIGEADPTEPLDSSPQS